MSSIELIHGNPLDLEQGSSVSEITENETAENCEIGLKKLRAILEGIDDVIYVSDPVTYELLYVNESFKRIWGGEVGKKCHKVFQNLDAPCPFCTNDRIMGENVGEPYTWEVKNRVDQCWYRCFDRAIQWIDGRWVRFEMAVDVTDYKRHVEEERDHLKRIRDQQAAIINLATHPSLAQGDFKTAIQTITEYVADALELERVSIWLLSDDRSELRCSDLYEQSKKTHSDGMVLKAVNYPDYFKALKAGRSIDAHDACTDPRTAEFRCGYLDPLGITSMLDAAIRVSGQVAGVLCCEQVGPKRQWHEDAILFAGEAADQAAQAYINQERKRSEAALRESENRLKTIIHSIQAGILLIDASTHKIADANPAALEMIGISYNKLIGRICHQFICPADKCSCPFYTEGNNIQNQERELLNHEGERIPILKTVTLVTLDGRQYYLESFVDNRKQKQSEKELKQQAEELQTAKESLEVLVSDTTGREQRMVELKHEVNELLVASGREPKYLAPKKTAALRSRR